jgi:hypothetical protein
MPGIPLVNMASFSAKISNNRTSPNNNVDTAPDKGEYKLHESEPRMDLTHNSKNKFYEGVKKDFEIGMKSGLENESEEHADKELEDNDAATDSENSSNEDVEEDIEDKGPKFILFPKLSVELRRRILNYDCFILGVIDLWFGALFEDMEEDWEMDEEFSSK